MLTLAAADTLAANAQTAASVTLTVFGMELVGSTETYKTLYQGQPGTGVATIYTVPASTTAFVKSIHAINTTTAQTFALYRGGTAAANRLTPDITLPANGWATYTEQGWQVYTASGMLLSGAALDIVTGSLVGPNPYAAGGFTLDLRSSLASLNFLDLAVAVPGSLPPVHPQVTINAPTAGQAVIVLMRHRYDRPTAVTGQPGGVTVAGASGQLTAAAAGTVSTVANALSVDALGAGTAQQTTHQHSHQHATNILYEHSHVLTQTDAASVEIGAVNLSGTTWRYLAVGV